MAHDDSDPAPSWRVDGRFVARANPDLETAEIGEEALVFHPRGELRVPLNPTAALVWACLDGESTLGEIAADLAEAFGAPTKTVLDDVVMVVAQFLAEGIALAVLGPRFSIAAPPGPRPLLEADFPLGDAGHLAVRLGDDTVGVRSNDAALLECLRGVLGPSLALIRGRARLSVLASPARGRIPGMCYLYRDDELVFATTSRGRMLRATIAHLDGFLPSPHGTVRLNANVLVGSKGAVLVGGAFREPLDVAGRRLTRVGLQAADGPAAFVDRVTFEAVVVGPRLDLDADRLAAMNTDFPPTPGERTREGSYPVRHVVLVGSEPDPARLASPVQRVAALLPLVTELGAPIVTQDVEWLMGLDRHVDTNWIFGIDDRELLATLDRLASRANRTLPR